MGRIILTPGGPRHPLEARAPAVRDEATVIIFLAVHSPSTPKVKVFPYTGSAYAPPETVFFLERRAPGRAP